MLIQTDLRTTHVMAPIPRSSTKGVLRVERQLVEDLQDYEPGWHVWGERLNSLSPLWPYSHFRDLLMAGAKKYVGDLSARGWRLLTNEGDLLIWGPCVAKAWAMAGQRGGVTQGRTGDDQYLPDVYDFLIDGQWLASTYLMETPSGPQPQRRLSRARRAQINERLFPRRKVGA